MNVFHRAHRILPFRRLSIVTAMLSIVLSLPVAGRAGQDDALLVSPDQRASFWVENAGAPLSVSLSQEEGAVPLPDGMMNSVPVYRLEVQHAAATMGMITITPDVERFDQAFYYEDGTGEWKRADARITAHGFAVQMPVRTFSFTLLQAEAQGVHLPNMRARAAVVLHAQSGTVFGAFRATEVMPLASLTKLMTALVVLDTKPSWDRNVTYNAADNRGGASLFIRHGERIRVRDLFATMLIGSANNATMALVRSTGLTEREFVERMNAKARSLGLLHTTFVEPTGLREENVSSALEYAQVAKAAFAVPLIRKTTTTLVHTFRTVGTRSIAHRIKNSNKLLTASPLTIQAGKTGYLDAGHSLVLQTKSEKGGSLITVLLNHPTSSGRFHEAETLATLAAALP